MANLNVGFKELDSAIDWSLRQFATPRKKYHEAIRQYVGNHYADGGSDLVVPTNFLELAVTIYMQQLAARAPRAMFQAKHPSLRAEALSAEIAINQLPDEIGLGDTLQMAVIQAMFSFGVVKTGIAPSGIEVMGYDAGQPFADIVSIDDYFCDRSAKTWKDVQFEGNDYWMCVEDAVAMWPNAKSKITADDHTLVSDTGDDKSESVSIDEGAQVYQKKVYCRDVWLVKERQLLTYGIKSKEIFNVVDWDGPEEGPYHKLGFSDVPGNLLPLPPVALWRDLHELQNLLFRKLSKQADKKKTVAAFPGGDDDAVEALKNAEDGEGINYGNSAKPENIVVGGIDAPTLAFYLQVKELSSYFAGNLNTMGGLSAASKTIGQDQLLGEAASARVNFMRGRVNDFAKEIFQALAWYDWTDPVRERIVKKNIPGTDISVTRIWSEETRDADWLDFNFSIDVYSMGPDTPEIRLQKIGTALERYIFPGLPFIEQQGGMLDMQAVLSSVARLSNVPEINEFVKFGQTPPQGNPPVGNPRPGLAPNTTRTYERVNRSGATESGKADVLSRLLMGGNVQQSEGASLGKVSE